ncbi:MAG: hypothetical protein ABH871_06920 [Pseudomonadota bacterium]
MNVAVNAIGQLTLPQLPGAFYRLAQNWGVRFLPIGIQTIYDVQGVPKSLDIEWSNDEDAFFQPKAVQTILHVPPLDRFEKYDPNAMAGVRKFLSHEKAPKGKTEDGRLPFRLAYFVFQSLVQKAHTEAQTWARGCGFDPKKIYELGKSAFDNRALEFYDGLILSFIFMFSMNNSPAIYFLRRLFEDNHDKAVLKEPNFYEPDLKALLHDVAFALRFIEEKELSPLKEDYTRPFDPWEIWCNVPSKVVQNWQEAMPEHPDIYDIIRIYKGHCCRVRGVNWLKYKNSFFSCLGVIARSV